MQHSNLFVENSKRVLLQEWEYLRISISVNLKSLQSFPGPMVYQSVLLASHHNFEMFAKIIYNHGMCLLKTELIGALQGSFEHILPSWWFSLFPKPELLEYQRWQQMAKVYLCLSPSAVSKTVKWVQRRDSDPQQLQVTWRATSETLIRQLFL